MTTNKPAPYWASSSVYVHNTMPRDRHNARLKAQYEKRKAKHLPVIAAMATTSTMVEIASATKTTTAFVSRVIKEEGLRNTATRRGPGSPSDTELDLAINAARQGDQP